MAGCAAAAPTLAALPIAPAWAESTGKAITQTRLSLGTVVTITALATSRQQAEEALGAAFEEIQRLEKILSRHAGGTAVSVLNDQGHLHGAPPELQQVLAHSAAASDYSGGAFDVTIAPVIELLKQTHGEPNPGDLAQALALVQADGVRMSGDRIQLKHTGMAVTLDGVAKGFIADAAASVLLGQGIRHFLIDAGGDMRAQGSPEGILSGRSWRIAIQDPEKQNEFPGVVAIRSGAIATSGGYELAFDAAKRSHHLISPSRGDSPSGVASVSVQAPTVMQADALATALSVMPPRQALTLTATLPHHACLLVTRDGACIHSSGWKRA